MPKSQIQNKQNPPFATKLPLISHNVNSRPHTLPELADAAIAAKWNALNGAPGGAAIAGRTGLVKHLDGYFRQYAQGRIYFQFDIGAFWVTGAIAALYETRGGATSWLGWPTSDEEPFFDGRASRFQNASIYFWPDVGAVDVGDVIVRYTGLFCFGETDEASDSDEPYALIATVPQRTDLAQSIRTRIYDGVDSGDSREDNIELYRGPPFGMQVVATVMEHDLEDPDKYLDAIKVAVAKASEAAAIGLKQIPYVGSFVAPIGEALLKAIGPDVVEALNGVVGGKDDLIGTQTFFISAKDMVRLTQVQRENLNGILWHLDSPLISDGEASYKVYVDVSG